MTSVSKRTDISFTVVLTSIEICSLVDVGALFDVSGMVEVDDIIEIKMDDLLDFKGMSLESVLVPQLKQIQPIKEDFGDDGIPKKKKYELETKIWQH